jgi:hypothetical protein
MDKTKETLARTATDTKGKRRESTNSTISLTSRTSWRQRHRHKHSSIQQLCGASAEPEEPVTSKRNTEEPADNKMEPCFRGRKKLNSGDAATTNESKQQTDQSSERKSKKIVRIAKDKTTKDKKRAHQLTLFATMTKMRTSVFCKVTVTQFNSD